MTTYELPRHAAGQSGGRGRKTGRNAKGPQSRRFWDGIAERYAASPIKDMASYEEKLAITRTYLTPGSRVFEFGCGTGGTAIAHAPHARRIDGTDLSPNMVEIARKKARAAGVDNVAFEVAAIEELPSPPTPYDMVLAMSVLHLVEDRRAVMRKVAGMLAPGGVFVSSTACLADSHPWFRFVGPVGRALGFFPLVRVFAADRLVAELEDAGFRVERAWRPSKKKALFVVARKL